MHNPNNMTHQHKMTQRHYFSQTNPAPPVPLYEVEGLGEVGLLNLLLSPILIAGVGWVGGLEGEQERPTPYPHSYPQPP